MFRKKLIPIFLALTLIIISQTACGTSEKEPVSSTEYNLLNTTCTITIYDQSSDTAGKTIKGAFDTCRRYENLLSKTVEGSDIYRINHGGGSPVEISRETYQLLQESLSYGDLSEGAFDVTVGKLSSLWNFSSPAPHVPDDRDIAAAILDINYKNIDLFESEGKHYARLKNRGCEIDLGGIAKGYIADRAAEYVKSAGSNSAIVNLGGNIVAIGEKDGGTPWKIGIERPFADHRDIVGSVKVKNKTVVTSGIYERMFVEDKKLYHHVLDVSTGYPVSTDLESVTLVGEYGQSCRCDALSTTCLLLGLEKATALIEQQDGVEAVFIDVNGEIHTSSGMEFTPSEQ